MRSSRKLCSTPITKRKIAPTSPLTADAAAATSAIIRIVPSGIGVRSISVTPPCCFSQDARRSQGNSGRQPRRREPHEWVGGPRRRPGTFLQHRPRQRAEAKLLPGVPGGEDRRRKEIADTKHLEMRVGRVLFHGYLLARTSIGTCR